MLKKISFALASVVVTAGMVSATGVSAEATPSASKTCKERGYNTIVAQKNLKKAGKTFGTAFITYNGSKAPNRYCLVARNKSGKKATLTLAVVKNNGALSDLLQSSTSGATGSITFDHKVQKEQFVSSSGVTGVSFYY